MDLGSFYARLPELGQFYRLVGYLLVAATVVVGDNQQRLAGLLVVCVVAWLQAWRRQVGAAWRGSLVAAAALCALRLSWPAVESFFGCRIGGGCPLW